MRTELLLAVVFLGSQAADAQTIRRSGALREVTMNPRTGQIRPSTPDSRSTSIWSAANTFGFYVDLTFDGANTLKLLDWGDIGPEAATIRSFQVSYSATGKVSDQQFMFYGDENGGDRRERTLLRGFNVVGLPGAICQSRCFGAWIVTLDLESAGPNFPFTIQGGDYDLEDGAAPNFSGVGLVDFGYTYGLLSRYDHARGGYGPLITVDDYEFPGSTTGPGETDAFELFEGAQGSWLTFAGTYSYGMGYEPGNPNTVYGQHWLDLSTTAVISTCSDDPPCVRSDIAPQLGDHLGNCRVDISDVGVLLANYAPGVSGKSRQDGDIAPLGIGDGFVDLRDLGQMLTDFGSRCR